jgi:hypothetical protein
MDDEDERQWLDQQERRRLRVRLQCKAYPRCWANHEKHECTMCNDDDSDHVERDCPMKPKKTGEESKVDNAGRI